MDAMDVSPSYVDGGEFTSEVASTMRRCFDHFDADGDGALSHAEFSGVYQCECAATAAAAAFAIATRSRATLAWPVRAYWLAAVWPHAVQPNLYVCVAQADAVVPSNTRATTRAHPNT